MRVGPLAWVGCVLAVAGGACSSGHLQTGPTPGTAGSAAGRGPAGGAGFGEAGTGGGAGGDVGTGIDGGQPADGGTPAACTPLPPIPRRLWRLSTEQWSNAVQSLLNLPTPPALGSTGGEAPGALFSDAALTVDAPMLYDIYSALDGATAQVDSTLATSLAPCADTTADGQTTCATAFVKAFASAAYRRPIADDELSDLMVVYAACATTSYNAGLELVMKAVLASPSFLFRTELGPTSLTPDARGNFPNTTLTPDEVAAQLSFTLLGNLPDAPLTAAAADGSLATTAGIQPQIGRLLTLPAARAHVTDLVLRWFGVAQLFSKVKDPALLAAASGPDAGQDETAIENDLWTSGQQFVSSILWNGSGKLDDLLTSQAMFVNGRLAKLYPDAVVGQAPAGDTTFVAATWPAAQGRSGLLTQPSYLWALSDPSLNSIVKRGKQIHDDLACQDSIGPPVELSTPDAMNVLACKSPDGSQTLSTCDSEILTSDARLAYQPCQTCHVQIDPYARVLQNFGPIGNYRTLDEAQRPINPVASFVGTQPPVAIPGIPGGISPAGSPLAPRTVTGAQGLAQALISTGVFDGCAAQRMLGVAIGQSVDVYDTCQLRPIRAASDGTIDSLFINLLSPDFMRARAGGPQ